MSTPSHDPEQSLWKELAAARDTEGLARPWLALQCRMIADVTRGAVLLGTPDKGPFEPVATWPESAPMSQALAAAAQTALGERRPVVRRYVPDGSARTPCDVGYPLIVDDKLCGVVALEIAWRPQAELRTVMRQLQWGAASVAGLLRRELLDKTSRASDRLVTALELVTASLEREHFQAAATGLVTDLATRMGCDRVSLGLRKGKQIRVKALSHSARFGERSNIMRAVGEAMDEAADQALTVVCPAPPEKGPVVTQAHAQLARRHGSGSSCTVLLEDKGAIVGALTLERPSGKPFTTRETELCEDVAALVGPILELKRLHDRWLVVKAWESAKEHWTKLAGPGNPGLKAVAAGVLCLLLFLALARGDFRIAADATLEGAVQRAIAAPLDGFVASAPVRAGDVVAEGDVICHLDQRELDLERLQRISEREQIRGRHRDALARRDRSQVGILQAQLQQADVQVRLVERQIDRLKLVAPFRGLVVSGDLSQALGAPVKRGDVLFEIAPLDAYRIILEVDERDIAHVAEGQAGTLRLSAIPERPLPVMVALVTPVSVAEEGKNFFRVEARLSEPGSVPDLRPGMEGVAKVEAGRRRLAWIWSRRAVDWLRVRLWSWMP